jgi:tetratricopeptide (TPR) repeat protein
VNGPPTFCSSGEGKGVEHDVQAELQRALAALRDGDVDAADAIVQQLLRVAPDDPAAHQLAAVIALQRGEFAEAARAATASLARRPDHAPTLVVAGRAARSADDLAGAAAFFARAVALAPERPDAAFLQCVTLLQLRDRQAANLLPQLLERFPTDAEGWLLVGDALQRAEQPEAALLAFSRAAQAAPSHVPHGRRGALLESLGRTAEAVGAYRAAIALAPENDEALFKLGVCLRRLGDRDGAAAALTRAAALGPANGDILFALGLLYQDQRDFAAAAGAYERALALRPAFAEAAVNLGICRQETGDLAAAKAAYGLALTLRPESFGRIAQALAAAPFGEVWLDVAALRDSLRGSLAR